MLSVKFGDIPGSILSMHSSSENVTWFTFLVPRLIGLTPLSSSALSVSVSLEVGSADYSAPCIEPTKMSTDGPSLDVYPPVVGLLASPSMV